MNAATTRHEAEPKPGVRLRIIQPYVDGGPWSVDVMFGHGPSHVLGYYDDEAKAQKAFDIFEELGRL